MSEHTKEPWDFERPEHDCFDHISGHYTSPDDYLLIWLADHDEYGSANYVEIHGPEQEQNAKRIVACVNACAGIENDELEHVGYAELLISHSTYERQINELEEINKELINQLKRSQDCLDKIATHTKDKWACGQALDLIEEIDEVVEKAEQ